MTDTLDAALGAWARDAAAKLAVSPFVPSVVPAGRVTRVFDGIAIVAGLRDARAGSSASCLPDDGSPPVPAMVHRLDRGEAGCVLLAPAGALRAGARVRVEDRPIETPVGDALLGRVVDPLGVPLDGMPVPATFARLPADRPAPAILARASIDRALHTGTTAIDALIPLGRGQRELIVGDRRTGKSTLALDAILAQRPGDVVCVHVSIGQRAAATMRAIESVRARGLAQNCVFVVAAADDPPGLQWLAPFAACAIAEYFRDAGRDALLVIDDLSKHAAAHRQIGLLLRDPPGREAYPGDVFYLHARLLERAAKLTPERGGGSLSILAIAETQAGDIAGYIPTNLISIVDGQIVCDAKLWALGRKPAIDMGRSVSRVGGRAQPPSLRALAGPLKLAYAQFLELEEFARFGGLADEGARARLAHGARLRAALAQPAAAPLPLTAQYALLSAVDSGLMDQRPVAEVGWLRDRADRWLRGALPELCDTLESGAAPARADVDRLRVALADFLTRAAEDASGA